MNPRVSGVFLLLITTACYAAAFLIAPLHGVRFWQFFWLPTVLLIFDVIWYILPRIDPIAKGFLGFRHVYDFAWILIAAFIAYVYALTLARAIGLSFNLLHALLPALGLLLICLGALMPLIKRNWFFGIRTPWTLSNDAVWTKTHLLGGKLFMLAGLVIMLAGLATHFLTVGAIIACVSGAIACAVILSVVYSYICWRVAR